MDFFRGWHGHTTYPATALVAVGDGRVGAGGCGRGEVRLVSTRWSVFVLVQPLLCGWGVRLARDASSSSQASTGQWMNRARRSAASRVNSPNGCRSSLESRDVVRAVRLFGSYCQALTSCVLLDGSVMRRVAACVLALLHGISSTLPCFTGLSFDFYAPLCALFSLFTLSSHIRGLAHVC